MGPRVLIRRTLFRPRTFCTGILYLAIVLELHCLCSAYLTLACLVYHEETRRITIPMNCLPYVISANVHSCVILLCSPLEKKNWRTGECVKELVELMKLQKKRRRDWASAEHVTERDVLSCLHNRGRTCYNTCGYDNNNAFALASFIQCKQFAIHPEETRRIAFPMNCFAILCIETGTILMHADRMLA